VAVTCELKCSRYNSSASLDLLQHDKKRSLASSANRAEHDVTRTRRMRPCRIGYNTVTIRRGTLYGVVPVVVGLVVGMVVGIVVVAERS
jgi:hypothetical protein